MALFVFDRTAVSDGEWWRLLTAHFTHSSTSHALWDVLAFTGVTLWLSQYSIKQMMISVVLGIVAVDILLLSSLSTLDYYCGLSGILFSTLVLACYRFRQVNRGVIGLLPMFVVSTKVLWELSFQSIIFVDTAWQAYPDAHLAGLTAGLVGIGFYRRMSRTSCYI
ncbi:MAG: rhombosortase [Candidatus Reddybacter sp.]